MAERLADIVTQIQNVRQLGAVVTAMGGIAASRAQKGRSLLPGIEAYTDGVSRAIGQALNLLPTDMIASPPHRRARLGLILFCAEQGLAGAFSEHVLDSASGDLCGAVNLIVGTRGVVVASERGIKPIWSAPMATHVDAIPSFANRLADALYGYVATGTIGKADIGRHSLLALAIRQWHSYRSSFPAADRLPALCPADRQTGSADHARAPRSARTPRCGVRFRAALPSGDARLRSGERSSHVGHGIR
jgi:hypothetical protein